MRGRKRQAIVDTMGLLLALFVTGAGVQDRDGGVLAMKRMEWTQPRMSRIWANTAYCGIERQAGWLCHADLDIVSRMGPGFIVQPNRWIVERTFDWLHHYRRLSKDYGKRIASSESMIHLTMTHLMLGRLCKT